MAPSAPWAGSAMLHEVAALVSLAVLVSAGLATSALATWAFAVDGLERVLAAAARSPSPPLPSAGS